MEKFKFINSEGVSLEISDSEPYILNDISGTGNAEANIQTSDPYQQNGSIFLDSLAKPRKIKIEVEIVGKDRTEMKTYTASLMTIFNSLLKEGTIIYTNDAGSWRIYGAVYDGPRIYRKDDYPFHQFASVSFFCADPFWLAPIDKQIKMSDFVGGLTFPMTFPITFAERGKGGKINYTGNVPAPMILDFRVADGGTSVTNPKIQNEKNEAIQVQRVILPGERLIINTNTKKLSVTHIAEDGTETDAWGSLYGVNNTYLQLHKGENVFQFSALSGDPELYLTYAARYSGIGK